MRRGHGGRHVQPLSSSMPWLKYPYTFRNAASQLANAHLDERKYKMNAGNVREEHARVAKNPLNRHTKLPNRPLEHGVPRTRLFYYQINESNHVRAEYLSMSTVRSYPPKGCEHCHSPAYRCMGLPFADHQLTGGHFAGSC